MKKNILILQYGTDNFFCNQYKKSGIAVENILKDINKIFKAIRLINKKSKIRFSSIWYGEWKRKLCMYDTVIVFDHSDNIDLVNYIHKKNKEIRIIFWFWNSVANSINPNLIDDKICEKWTFDHRDAVKYHMKENTQYYFEVNYSKRNSIKNDVFFVGIDKEREEILEKCKEIFEDNELSYNLNVVKEKKTKLSINKKYYNYMKYEDVINGIMESKAILDIVNNEKQYGITLRPLEAIFYEKKLITTCQHIDQFDFYNKENIFILGKDDVSNLKYFISSKYKKVDKEIKKKYTFNNWLNRFFI